MPRIATIGVYEFDAPSFVETLDDVNVTQLIDVRQRRGVRGPRYAWANARRLQAMLSEAQIGYEYHPELAPTTELRHLQYREDDRRGVGKRSRARLADAYREGYLAEILDRVDLAAIVQDMPRGGRSALMCVERDPEACHRSLIADRLAAEHGLSVVHLRP